MTVDDDLDARRAPVGARHSSLWPAIVEIVATVVAVDATVLIFLNYVGAHLAFLGAPAHILEQDVQRYWVLAAVLTVAVLVSFGAAGWRRARRAFVWHLAVAVVGVLVALTFPVTQAGPVREEPAPAEVERPERPDHSPCYSGGDSDECVGG